MNQFTEGPQKKPRKYRQNIAIEEKSGVHKQKMDRAEHNKDALFQHCLVADHDLHVSTPFVGRLVEQQGKSNNMVAPLWCDLGFVPNSRGNKAAANLRPNKTNTYEYISYI